MANLNKYIGIGRLTREPEVKTFGNGGKVAKLGFVVNEKKKNAASGKWEDSPIFLDVEVFNRGEHGKLADTVEKYCKKGDQIGIVGKLAMDEWNDKTTGQKRTKLKVVADEIILMGSKSDDDGNGGSQQSRPQQSAPQNNRTRQPAFSGGGDDDVPF